MLVPKKYSTINHLAKKVPAIANDMKELKRKMLSAFFVFISKEVKIIIAVKAVVNNNIASDKPSAVSAIETCGLLIH
jgi:hypothetical protein